MFIVYSKGRRKILCAWIVLLRKTPKRQQIRQQEKKEGACKTESVMRTGKGGFMFGNSDRVKGAPTASEKHAE